MPKRRTAEAARPGTPNSRVRLSVATATMKRVEAAPALVAREQLGIAEVEAEPRALDQHLGQRGGVAEAEIEALAGDRMDAVRGVADQREPLGGDPRGMVEAERIVAARPGQRDRAEEAAHPLLDLVREARGPAAPSIAGASRALTDQTIAERWPAILAGQHRQDRERAVGIEDLVGDRLVRPFVRDRWRRSRHDRSAIARPRCPAASRVGELRPSAPTSSGAATSRPSPSVTRDAVRRRARPSAGRAGMQQVDPLRRRSAVSRSAARSSAVLDHDAERIVVRVRARTASRRA